MTTLQATLNGRTFTATDDDYPEAAGELVVRIERATGWRLRSTDGIDFEFEPPYTSFGESGTRFVTFAERRGPMKTRKYGDQDTLEDLGQADHPDKSDTYDDDPEALKQSIVEALESAEQDVLQQVAELLGGQGEHPDDAEGGEEMDFSERQALRKFSESQTVGLRQFGLTPEKYASSVRTKGRASKVLRNR